MNFSDGVACLGIGGSGHGAGVEDDDGSRGRAGGGGKAAIQELAFESGAIGLRGAAAELLDEEGGHLALRDRSLQRIKIFSTQSSQRARRRRGRKKIGGLRAL